MTIKIYEPVTRNAPAERLMTIELAECQAIALLDVMEFDVLDDIPEEFASTLNMAKQAAMLIYSAFRDDDLGLQAQWRKRALELA